MTQGTRPQTRERRDRRPRMEYGARARTTPGREGGAQTGGAGEGVSPERRAAESALKTWQPRTNLGKKVLAGEIRTIDEALQHKHPILEPEIVDMLLPNLEVDLLLIGQSKGKFGGGKRRAFRQTQRKTQEGNVISFTAIAVVGNCDGYVGVGMGKSKETVPAREKAVRNAKLNIMRIRRGSGSWETGRTKEPISIPFKVSGKCGSAVVTLIPAPKGIGLCVHKECQKILRLAGIGNVWSKVRGQTVVRTNVIAACVAALSKLSDQKVHARHYAVLGMVNGALRTTAASARSSEGPVVRATPEDSDREFAQSMAVTKESKKEG